MREGVAGYGCYWMMLEMLRDCPKYRTFYFPESFAYSFHVQDVSLIERVCKDYGLFEFDNDEYISSPWLDTVMDEYDEQKKKRSEAGRRGAARRWASSSMEDGKAIALPSMEDGKAIAYNIMKPNITLPNETLNIPPDGKVVDIDYLDMLCKTQPEGHAPGYVAQVCMRYKMKESTCEAICEASENARIGNSTYKAFAELVKRIEHEKFVPKYPDNFFLSKLLKK